MFEVSPTLWSAWMIESAAASRVAVIMYATRRRIGMFTVVVWLRMSGAAVRVGICARTGRSKHHRACVRRLIYRRTLCGA
jgi:hypothetical protein